MAGGLSEAKAALDCRCFRGAKGDFGSDVGGDLPHFRGAKGDVYRLVIVPLAAAASTRFWAGQSRFPASSHRAAVYKAVSIPVNNCPLSPTGRRYGGRAEGRAVRWIPEALAALSAEGHRGQGIRAPALRVRGRSSNCRLTASSRAGGCGALFVGIGCPPENTWPAANTWSHAQRYHTPQDDSYTFGARTRTIDRRLLKGHRSPPGPILTASDTALLATIDTRLPSAQSGACKLLVCPMR